MSRETNFKLVLVFKVVVKKHELKDTSKVNLLRIEKVIVKIKKVLVFDDLKVKKKIANSTLRRKVYIKNDFIYMIYNTLFRYLYYFFVFYIISYKNI